VILNSVCVRKIWVVCTEMYFCENCNNAVREEEDESETDDTDYDSNYSDDDEDAIMISKDIFCPGL